jgi:hypothetical protein
MEPHTAFLNLDHYALHPSFFLRTLVPPKIEKLSMKKEKRCRSLSCTVSHVLLAIS